MAPRLIFKGKGTPGRLIPRWKGKEHNIYGNMAPPRPGVQPAERPLTVAGFLHLMHPALPGGTWNPLPDQTHTSHWEQCLPTRCGYSC